MKVIKIFSACLFLLPFVSCTQVTNDKGDTAIEKKVEALLSKMTLEEKLGQMNQITSYGNIEDMSGLIKQGGAGSILNETDPVRINALQRVAIEESRLSIPLLMARDVIHGFKTIFPIHNIAYQGKYGTDILEDTCGIGRRDQHIVEYDGCANFMKGAFETADKITTVSPTYAMEILDPWFSYGLDALLREKQYKLCGILNGIDTDSNDPATDKNIPFNYDITNFEEGKAKCKEALQDKFGLNKDGSPVFAMVSRMVGMKGFDLVQSIADGLVDRGIELVVLGSGESQYENFFSDLCARHPGRVGTYIGFEPALSQEIYAGADAFIMPSKSEPCGLAQMVACRYGTPPIVRETGGLRDSIHDSTMGEGNGFTFAGYNAHELYVACCNAQNAYYDKENWKNLVHHCMECDFSWDVSAKSYEGLYNETANLW